MRNRTALSVLFAAGRGYRQCRRRQPGTRGAALVWCMSPHSCVHAAMPQMGCTALLHVGAPIDAGPTHRGYAMWAIKVSGYVNIPLEWRLPSRRWGHDWQHEAVAVSPLLCDGTHTNYSWSAPMSCWGVAFRRRQASSLVDRTQGEPFVQDAAETEELYIEFVCARCGCRGTGENGLGAIANVWLAGGTRGALRLGCVHWGMAARAGKVHVQEVTGLNSGGAHSILTWSRQRLGSRSRGRLLHAIKPDWTKCFE